VNLLDVKLFRAINRLSGRYLIVDKIMILISNKMRYVFFFIIITMLFRKRKVTMEAVMTILATLFMHFLIKLFYFKPRPFIQRKVGILIPSKSDSTFPSKHTLLTFAVSTIICIYYRFLGSIMLGLSFLTGLSRIWVGHHYPSDILGSSVIGSFTSLVVHKIAQRREKEII
jgi:undecaprenyl-diphosphatase